MRLRKYIIFVGFCLCLLGLKSPQPPSEFEVQKNLDIFYTALSELEINYVDEIDIKSLTKIGIDAMLKDLDPYTSFIPSNEIQDYTFQTTGNYAGIGARVRTIDGYPTIILPYPNFPAHKAGLRAGDQVIAVDGQSTKAQGIGRVSRGLKGPAGTAVILTVKSPNSGETRDVEVVREQIHISSVDYSVLLGGNVAYLKLGQFTRMAAKEAQEAIDQLKQEGAESLILDLRGNPGGLLSEALNVANLFLPRGKEIVSTKGQLEEWQETMRAKRNPSFPDMPLCILMDERSASASEIVAGAIQDYDRGLIIGRQSFGKGLVQTSRSLPYNNKVKITTAQYYTPSGRGIQAINYSNQADGPTERLPDSLRSSFKTTNGRTVLDGSGIDPDIEIEENPIARIAWSLNRSNLVFKFANQFVGRYNTISNPENFSLSDEEFKLFKSYVEDQNFNYQSRGELAIKKLEEALEVDRINTLVKKEFEAVEDAINAEKRKDLDRFKKDIVKMIELELVRRYYFEKGEHQYRLVNDQVVVEALEVLKNPSNYESKLQP